MEEATRAYYIIYFRYRTLISLTELLPLFMSWDRSYSKPSSALTTLFVWLFAVMNTSQLCK